MSTTDIRTRISLTLLVCFALACPAAAAIPNCSNSPESAAICLAPGIGHAPLSDQYTDDTVRGLEDGQQGRWYDDTMEQTAVVQSSYATPEERYVAYLARAQAESNLGLKDQAIADATQAIALNPTKVAAYGIRGALYALVGQNDAAIADESEVIARDPNNLRAYVARVYIYGSEGIYFLAIEDATKAIILQPKDAALYGLRSVLYVENLQPQPGLADAEREISLKPYSAAGYRHRAAAFTVMQSYAKAISSAGEAISLKSSDPANYLARCYAELGAGQNDAAISDATKAIGLQPSALAYGERADAYGYEKRWADEITDATKAIALSPLEEKFYFSRSKAELHLGMSKQAAADAETALKFKPGDVDVMVHLSRVFLQQHQPDLAIQDLTKALEISPGLPDAVINLGIAYGEKGDWKADADQQSLALHSPGGLSLDGYSVAYSNRIYAYRNEGRFDLVVKDESSIISLIPERAMLWNNRCWDHIKIGQLQDALADCNQALLLSPKPTGYPGFPRTGASTDAGLR